MKKISDNSRRFSLLALKEIEKVKSKYSHVPDAKNLSEEQVSWLNERIRFFHENVKKTNYKKFSFLEDSRKSRNTVAHSTTDITKEETQKIWNTFFNFKDEAEVELEENIKRSSSQNKEIRQFENFGSPTFGNELERKKLTQAIEDKLNSSLSDDEKVPFNNTECSKQIENFFETENQTQNELLKYAGEHSKLNEQIQSEIINTVSSAYEETDISNPQNPFFNENNFLQKIENLDSKDLMNSLGEIQNQLLNTKTGKNNSTDFSFYKKQIEKLNPKDRKDNSVNIDKNQIEILARNLKNDLQKSLQERFTNWQLEEIDKERKEYLEELYKKIEQFKKLEELLAPFIKDFGRLWGMSSGNFDDLGFEVIQQFADLLENDKSLQELAELIGRQSSESDRYEKELRDKVEVKTEFHTKPAYRGQISGLRLSGEISAALPSELALYKNPKTKMYFAKKFAEKKMLSYAYINQQKKSKEEHKAEEVEVAVIDKKGPVIICVDTSGSMNGTPERVAKTITFALAKKCLAEERKCYLISFSTDIEVQDLSEFSKSDGLSNLVSFLRMSFNGGTDANPALIHAVKLLEKNEWKNADVLMVSDFVMGELSESLGESIKKRQEEKTKFYSLVIGNSGNKNTINSFDENWSYDTTATNEMYHLVRNLKCIK